MKRMFSTKRRIAAVGLGVAMALAGGGAALAYFTSTGSGSGTGKVGAATNWTVVGGSEAGNLYPLVYPNGAQALAGGSVTNAGSGYQKLQTIVATIVAPTGGSNSPNACTSADFQLYSPTATWTITTTATTKDTATINPNVNLAPAGVYNMSDLSVAMVDNGANQDGCAGATVHISYAAS
jgi:hypothetical protein